MCGKLPFDQGKIHTHDLLSSNWLININILNTMTFVSLHPEIQISFQTASMSRKSADVSDLTAHVYK